MFKHALITLALAAATHAHVGVWAPGMYCRGGADPSTDDQNTNLVVNPLYDLAQDDWWMQHDRGCDAVPPPSEDEDPANAFLDLPAGGSFTVELAINRAFTTLSYDGENTSDWPDGEDHPEDWAAPDREGACLMDNPDGHGGPLHAKGQDHAAGTAWAISYEEDLGKVNMENLVVFSVLEHTPWKRLATYEVPAEMPACPEGGCYCAWLWVPDGCGEPNMYMQNFKCRVTNTTSSARELGTAQVPAPCADDPSECVKGPKQMIAWNQAEGNNVGDIGFSPGYNAALGFFPGAQDDIFVGASGNSEEGPEPVDELPVSRSSSVIGTTPSTPTTSASSSVETLPAETDASEAGSDSDDCKAKKLRRRRAREQRAARAAAIGRF